MVGKGRQSSGQFYEASTIVINESRVVNISNLLVICKLRSSRLYKIDHWSSGYGRRLMSWRPWVRIPAPYTSWTYFHAELFKNSILCLFVTDWKWIKRGRGWPIFFKKRSNLPPMSDPTTIAAATNKSPMDQQRHFRSELLLFVWPGRLSFVTINFSPLKWDVEIFFTYDILVAGNCTYCTCLTF